MIYYCSKKNSPFGILMFITWFQLQIMFFFVRGLETFIFFFTIFHICFCWVTWLPEAYSMFCRGVELGSAVSRVLGPHQIGDELIGGFSSQDGNECFCLLFFVCLCVFFCFFIFLFFFVFFCLLVCFLLFFGSSKTNDNVWPIYL